MKLVPNKFPRSTTAVKRLAIVGEAPGYDEEVAGEPFVGASGRYLRLVLGSVNHAAEHCLLANICQIRPPNEIDDFSFDGPEIQSGIEQLKEDLRVFNPNCILALGRSAFRVFNPEVCGFDKKGTPIIPLGNWRGSVFRSTLGGKTVGTYHPAYILRAFGDSGLFRFDVARAVNQSSSPEIPTSVRSFVTRPSLQEVLDFCTRINANSTTIAFDIEGICDHIGCTMVSLFTSPDSGIVIPFWLGGSHYWSAEEEPLVWAALASVLSNPNIRKIAQNGLYETFVLLWKHKLVVENLAEDTMLKHWELFPEFEKSLAVQASIYTLEPYYKDDRTSPDTETKLIYNAKDSAVTYECSLSQDELLRKYPRSAEHYRFNMDLLPAFSYMSLRGVQLDAQLLAHKKSIIQNEIDQLQTEVDRQVLEPALAAEVLTRKRKSDPWHFNADSGNQVRWLLFDYLGYKEGSRRTKTGLQKTDEETLHRFYQKHREPLVKTIIQLVSKLTRRSDLEKLTCNEDGRIRCGYNPVGTVTGRLSSSASSSVLPYFTKTGILKYEWAGTNFQNQTKDVREVFSADPDCLFFQCDLSGADAWTVAADLAALGHPTMLEDLKAGIKPAKVLLGLLQEFEAGRDPAIFNQKSREFIKAATDAMVIPDGILPDGRPGDWKYTCMKRVQHGTNYGMQPEKLSATIFKDSDGLIDLPPKDAEFYQLLYRLRYNPNARTEWIRSELQTKGAIQTASGIRRKFYSLRGPRMVDDAVLREALSSEPQANTTYICNRALRNMWYDPTNRTSKGSLFVEPLIQIHDAIAGQFRSKHLEFARERLHQWTNIPLVIHGIEVTIPFDGKYGPNWLQQSNKL